MKNAHMTKEELDIYRQAVRDLLLLPSIKRTLEDKYDEARRTVAQVRNLVLEIERSSLAAGCSWIVDVMTCNEQKTIEMAWSLTKSSSPNKPEKEPAFLVALSPLETAIQEMKKWERLLRRTKPMNQGTLDIERAKSIPIQDIHSFDKLRFASGSVSYALCPFHNEDSPSFAIYNSQNKGHCFGCGWHGDVIDFIRKRDGLTFPQAVKSLTS